MPDEMPPEAETAVRRALADVRVTDPMPADVAARLEATLRELGGERNVIALAPRRRRRFGPALVASAAVVAVGVGVGAIVASSQSGGDMMSSDAGADQSAPKAEADDAMKDQATAKVDPQSSAQAPLATKSDAGRAALSADTLRRDLLSVRASREAYAFDPQLCPLMPDDAVAAVLDDETDVFLTFGQVSHGKQRVRISSCADGTRIESVVLPAP